jgi:hypothetical protein
MFIIKLFELLLNAIGVILAILAFFGIIGLFIVCVLGPFYQGYGVWGIVWLLFCIYVACLAGAGIMKIFNIFDKLGK